MNDQLKYLKYKKKYLFLKKILQKGGSLFIWPSSNLNYDELIGQKIKILKIVYRPIDSSYNTNMEKLKMTTCKILNITDENLIIDEVFDFQNIPLQWLNNYDIQKVNYEILELTIEIINENCIFNLNNEIKFLNDKINFIQSRFIKE